MNPPQTIPGSPPTPLGTPGEAGTAPLWLLGCCSLMDPPPSQSPKDCTPHLSEPGCWSPHEPPWPGRGSAGDSGAGRCCSRSARLRDHPGESFLAGDSQERQGLTQGQPRLPPEPAAREEATSPRDVAGRVVPGGCQLTAMGRSFAVPRGVWGAPGERDSTLTSLGWFWGHTKQVGGAQPFPGQRHFPGRSFCSDTNPAPPLSPRMEPGRANELELGSQSHLGGFLQILGGFLQIKGSGRRPDPWSDIAVPWPDAAVPRPDVAVPWPRGWSATSREHRETDGSRRAASTPNFNETNKLIS